MSKNNFSSKVRIALFKGMEAIGTSASNLASNAKLKVNEINLENRRREILTDFSLQAFELWQNGTQLPAPLDSLFQELSEIEERLSVLRAQKYGKVAAEPSAESKSAEDKATAEDEPEPVECSVDTAEGEPQQPVTCTLDPSDAVHDTPVEGAETAPVDTADSPVENPADEAQKAPEETPADEAQKAPEETPADEAQPIAEEAPHSSSQPFTEDPNSME